MYQARDLAVVDWLLWHHRAGLALLPARAGRLVDVGCGNGSFVAAARARGFDACGIDFSTKAIEAGRRRFGLEQLYPYDIEELRTRFGANAFDVATAFEVLEHVDDVGRFLGALNRLLRPDGYLVVSVPNRERRPRLLNEGDLPPHHFTRWNGDAMRTVLRMYGFEVEDTVICPANITIKNWIIVNIHFDLVVRMLRRAESRPSDRGPLLSRAKSLIVFKDKLAGRAASLLAPILAPFVRGPMMVTLARKTKEVLTD